MAFSNPSTSGSGRSTPTTLAEINVTPLVDVMLVLLIVFMISAPLMQQGVQVDLPKANAGTLSDTPEQIMLVVNKERQIQINGNILPQGTLLTRLQAMAEARPQIQVFIQADQAVPYGFIAQVMAEVKKARINHVGLVTEPGDLNLKL